MDIKKIIVEAFMDIIKTTPIDKVTTNMILEKSSLSRATFYRHFRDKYEVIEYYHRKNVDELLEKYDYSEYKSLIHDLAEFSLNNSTCSKRVNEDERTNPYKHFIAKYVSDYYEGMIKAAKGVDRLSPEDEYAVRYLSEGLKSISDTYSERGYIETADEITEIVCGLLPPFLADFIETN